MWKPNILGIKYILQGAGVAKLVTAIDSKSIGGNPLGVRVSPPAHCFPHQPKNDKFTIYHI